ncbi:MAG TPA: hypothetical protein VIH87_02260 [Methylocella sp.]
MRLFDDLPWWARIPFSIGGVLMATFSNALPIGLQTAGLYVGIALAIFGLAATVWHFVKTRQLLSTWKFQWPITKHGPLSSTMQAGLYVGEIYFDLSRLDGDRYIEIAIRVFNCTGSIITMSGLKGSISFGAIGGAPSIEEVSLPPPTIRADTDKTIHPSREWFVILAQHVPAATADTISSLLSEKRRVKFDLDALDILVCLADQPDKIERLPLWNGLTFEHGISRGRIVKASLVSPITL